MISNYNTLHQHASQNLNTLQNELFVRDMLGLFTNAKQGHMESWEYGSSMFAGDMAGGGRFWDLLIKSPGEYYLVKEEAKLMRETHHSTDRLEIADIKTVIELGPGSVESLKTKTIPFIDKLNSAPIYIPVGAEEYQLNVAAQYIKDNTKVSKSFILTQNFSDLKINFPRLEPSALIMWGGSIGNIAGAIGNSPLFALKNTLKKFHDTIALGDFIFITFDTQDDEQAILNAYNQPLMSACFLSTLHRLVRDNLVSGDFDPKQWRHESIWIAETMQCAHTLYPLVDQNFVLNGIEINIPSFKRFVTNNSYKFKAETMKQAAAEAGFKPQIIQYGPMALLVAEKL